MRFCLSWASLIDSQPMFRHSLSEPHARCLFTLIVLSASQSLLLYKENNIHPHQYSEHATGPLVVPFPMFLCGTLNFSIFKGDMCWSLRTFKDYFGFPIFLNIFSQMLIPTVNCCSKWFLALFTWVLFIVCFQSLSLKVPSQFQGFLRMDQYRFFGYIILNSNSVNLVMMYSYVLKQYNCVTQLN